MKLQRILVPVDFSECSQAALRLATDLAQTMHADVCAFHVLWSPPLYAGLDILLLQIPREGDSRASLRDYLQSRAEQALTDLIEPLGEHWRFRIEKRLAFGNPAREILEVARAESFDLIVMGSHGHGALAERLMGGVCNKVLHDAPCPVLTVRAPAGRPGPDAGGSAQAGPVSSPRAT